MNSTLSTLRLLPRPDYGELGPSKARDVVDEKKGYRDPSFDWLTDSCSQLCAH